MSRRAILAREKCDFRRFRRVYELPAGKIVHDDKPDVRVVHEGKNVLGIELTNLFHADGSDKSSEQQQREFRKSVVEMAQKEFLKDGGSRIELSVTFNDGHPIRGCAAIAHELATVARSAQSGRAGKLNPLNFESLKEVRSIHVNPAEYEDPRWRVQQVSSVPLLLVERVKAVVAGKEKKLDGYQKDKACNAYWLLIVVDFFDPTQDQDTRWPTEHPPLETRFERVLIYRSAVESVTDLPVTRH